MGRPTRLAAGDRGTRKIAAAPAAQAQVCPHRWSATVQIRQIAKAAAPLGKRNPGPKCRTPETSLRPAAGLLAAIRTLPTTTKYQAHLTNPPPPSHTYI